jgi:hypothetical protein
MKQIYVFNDLSESFRVELEVKLSACIAKYTHNKNSLNYINSLAVLCAYSRRIIHTEAHTNTKALMMRSRAMLATSLKYILSDVDLVTLHNHVDAGHIDIE